jgi:eukaryotic-like serine/threonine-protein kinase
MDPHIGKYIVERMLGSGSFGEVYRATDPDLQKSVAIKKLKTRTKAHQEGDQQADTRLLFTREAQDTSKLTHPNIVTVHGFGIDEADGGPYIVMELLEGQTLEQFIRKRSHMPLVQKIEIMHQVAEGLQFAHTRGVIHRDIKPANMMVLPDGTAKVMDFAVAPEGFLVGTPAYMAPEQFAGHGSDVLTDIFAYGLVYYELITGERAYDPNVPERTQTSRYEPARVASVVPDCPPWLDLLISRLIAKRRDGRIETLEEMLIETRPTLQKLKQDRAVELASAIAPLMKTDREAANRLIDQVLRLDPLNREARTWRGTVQSGQREQARARAQELAAQGEGEFARGEFDKAQRTFTEALELDVGNPAIEKLLDKARAKAEDCRTSRLLVEEVIDDITAAGPAGMASWQVESAFNKLAHATRLDERNEDAAALRNELLPVYERICDRKMAPHAAAETQAAATQWEAWYAKRLQEARKARKNREFDYAQDILRKLLPHAPDERAKRELAAVAEDQEAHRAAEEALGLAAAWKERGNLEGALRQLDDFAERYPRRAKAVEQERRALQKELELLTGGA